MSRRLLMSAFFPVILAVVAIDQATKVWIMRHFALYESKVVIADLFNLTYLTNNGAAFSILAGQPAVWRQLFFIGAAGAALVFIWIAQRSFGRNSIVYSLSLALIAGEFKPLVHCHLIDHPLHNLELQRLTPNATPKMLSLNASAPRAARN